MLASISSLKSIATEAREALDTAQALHEQVADDDDDDDGLGEHEAAQQFDDEYAPLIATPALERHQSLHNDDDDDVRVRKFELKLAYIIFFILGATVLLPWNTLLVSASYFRLRFANSPYSQSYMSWVSVLSTCSNLFFLLVANLTQSTSRPTLRILCSTVVITVITLLFAISTWFESLDPTWSFPLLMCLIVIYASATGFLQNAAIALSSMFGPSHMQANLSGQGAIGATVALVQLISSLSTTQPHTSSQQQVGDGWVDAGMRKGTAAFYLVSMTFAMMSILARTILIRLPYYKLVIVKSGGIGSEGQPTQFQPRNNTSSSTTTLQEPEEKPSIRTVEPKIRFLGFLVFTIFFTTLSIFPSLTASITSTSHKPWTSTSSFIAIHFLIFNVCDWLGRMLPHRKNWVVQNRLKLLVLTLMRILFVGLFLSCHIEGSTKKAFISNDFLYFIILASFAISSGYLSTCIMITGISLPSLQPQEVDTAATCLAFYLTFGLASGSLMSFAIRGWVCHCNPFLQ